MFKKNTRKRLLAGALATVMMLTMCPSWALAGDEDIAAPLPLVDENRPVAESAPVEADTTETPAVPTPSEPEAKPAEDQNTAPAPSDDGANGGTDSTESGNSTNPTVSKDSENNSQNNDVVSNSPENEISLQETPIDLAWHWQPEAKYFVLLPNRDKPTSGESQGPASYLPNKTSDGGVTRCTNLTGYKGHLTAAGKKIADEHYSIYDATNGYTKIDDVGVESEYLDLPENLGFFDKNHWNGATYQQDTNVTDITTLLGENFNPQIAEVVWYTIKKQPDGYHVDGYVKNVDVTVTYHSNYGADVTDVYTARTGEEYTALDYADTELLDRENYTFDGWYTNPDCTEAYETDTLMTSLDLYAKWVQDKFDVTYYVDGEKQVDATEKHAVGDNVNVSSTVPTKAGYTFKGWKTDDVTVKNDRTFTMPAKEVRFDAEFEISKHNVTYYVDNKQYGTTEEHAVGTDVAVSSTIPTKAGYTFKGWKTTDVTVINGTFTMPEQDVRFDAEFEINKHNVTYYVDNKQYGTTEEHAVGTDVAVSSTIPTKAGYTFKGWKTTDVTVINGTFTMPEQDVRFDAEFEKNKYTVTYYVDGEKYGAEQTYLYGDPVTLAAKPTRDGFNFNGWLPEGVALNATGTGFQMPANDVVIRGTFDANSFYVAYYVDGILYASELYKTGENVTIRGDLAKDGFTFSGWTRDNVKAENFDMPAHNVEIHGSYRQNKHNYTINKHFYDEKGAEIAELASTATAPGAENALIADLYKNDAVNQTDKDGKTYVYVPGLTTVTDKLETLTKDVTIDLYYYLNVEGGNDIPDAWEYRLTFKVVNGSWNDGTSADIVTYVQCKDKKTGEAFEAEDVVVPVTRIPAVGDKPNSGYHAGAWDTSPYDNYKVQKDTVFTYTYAKNSSGGSSGGHHRKPTVTIPDKVPTGLNGNDHYAYIVGYPDKTVRPQNGITRAEVATIFFRLLTDETRNANSTKSNSYSDVAAGAWYNHAVSTLSAMGIVKGDSNGKFNPNAPITRAEFAAIAARFDDKANSTTADFSDIVSHWAKNEISAASNNGWINGYPDGTFRPDNKITRAEAMTLVNRVLKRLPETAEDLHDDMIKWSDNSDASQWFYLAVQEATNSHYYKAKENKFEKWSELRDTRDWTELEK